MAYTIHNELTDATLEAAFISYSSKKVALRVARQVSKRPAFQVSKIVVCNSEGLSIADFSIPTEGR